jgi:hypothetical protein
MPKKQQKGMTSTVGNIVENKRNSESEVGNKRSGNNDITKLFGDEKNF